MQGSAIFCRLAIVLTGIAFVSCSTSTVDPSSTATPSATGGGPTGGPSGGPSGGSTALQDLVDETIWPSIAPIGAGVTVELAGSGTSERIDPAGGSVETVGADGTRYVLTVPANALTFETEIHLTPVSAVTGYSVEASALYGVDVAPHDLMLWNAATLEIFPAAGADISHAVAVAYRGSGAGLHRTPLGRDASRLQIVLAHFSGGLVYAGDGIYLPALPAPEPLSFDDLKKSVAEATERERSGEATAEETTTSLEALFDQYMRDSLIPSTAKMRADCDYGKRHVWEYISFVRQAQLLGMEHVVERHTDDVNGSALIGDVIAKCWEDESGECVRYDPRQIRELIGLARQAQIVGRDLDVEQYAPTVCGNTGGQVAWSNDGHSVTRGNPWTLTVDDHYEATVWVTGQFSDGIYEDRGSRYTYQGLGTFSDVGGACEVQFVGRTFGEGQATDVYLEINGTEAYFSASVDGTNHGNRTDCGGQYYEDQPNFGAVVTCPDESGGVMGTFDAATGQVVFDCQGTHTEDSDPSVTGTSSFAVSGSLSMQGYEDIVDFIKAQAVAR